MVVLDAGDHLELFKHKPHRRPNCSFSSAFCVCLQCQLSMPEKYVLFRDAE